LIIYGLITYLEKEKKKEVLASAKALNIGIKNNYLRLFFKGFFLNFINVGVLAFWLGIVLVIGPILKMDQPSIFCYFGTILTSYFLTDLGKIFLAKKLKTKMTPLVINQTKKIMGIILIFCGVFLMLKGFIPTVKFDDLIKISE